jgi:hypothetical protein
MNRKTLKMAVVTALVIWVAQTAPVKPEPSQVVAELTESVTIVTDLNASKIGSFQVATYLGNLADRITLDTRFSSLASGNNYLQQSVLNVTGKQV